MKKKKIIIIIAVIVILSFLASLGSKNDSSESEKSVTTENSDISEKEDSSEKNSDVSDEKSSNDADKKDVSSKDSEKFSPVGDSLAIDFDIYGPQSFRNDETGKWYKALIAESGVQFQYYALNYYREYFNSDDEVHVIYNFSTNTATCINCAGSFLSVRVYDYVDGEEHDAKAALGGTKLGEYYVDIATGTVEEE